MLASFIFGRRSRAPSRPFALSFPPTTSASGWRIWSTRSFEAMRTGESTASSSSSTTTRRTAPDAIADDLAREYRITVIHRAGKLGLGTAVVAGFEAASAPVVGVIDADLSHPPEMLPAHARGDEPDVGGRRDRQPLHSGRRHAQLAVPPTRHVAARMFRRAAADAGRRRDVRVLPHPPRPGAHGADLGRRLQDLPGAARPRPARHRSSRCPTSFRIELRARAR